MRGLAPLRMRRWQEAAEGSMTNLKTLKDFLRDQVKAGVTYAHAHTNTCTHAGSDDGTREERLFILDVRREHKTFRDAAHLFGTYEFFLSFLIEMFSNKLYFITTTRLGLSQEWSGSSGRVITHSKMYIRWDEEKFTGCAGRCLIS